MPPAKEEDGKQPPKQKHKKKDQSSKPPEVSSESEGNGHTKKKEGFSILNSLAKFMSREKSETAQSLEPLTETEEISENNSSPLAPIPNEVATQTSELKIHRSSTLIAIAKATTALKEVRRRIMTIPKRIGTGEEDILQSKETQTSNSDISLNNDLNAHDHHLLLRNKSFHGNESSSSLHSLHNTSSLQLQPVVVHKEGRRINPHTHHQHSHVTFKGTPEYYEVNISSTPSNTNNYTYNESTGLSTDDGDDDSFDDGKILFHSTPKPGKGNSIGAGQPYVNHYSFKIASFQTEPELEIRGTQTSFSAGINDSHSHDSAQQHAHHSESENSLVRRIFLDREKCPKCDLFEMMFLHGGEKVLNDKEMLSMFKRHMNSHLLKAQEDLNKLYKWPRRVAEIEDVTEQEKISADREQPREMDLRTNAYPGNNFDENKSRQDEVASIPTKNEIGTPPRAKKVDADDDETRREGTENFFNTTNFSETKGGRRDTSRHEHSRDRDYSSSYERILKEYLASRNGDCSEEVIIRRKQRHNDGHNRQDSFNGYDDGYYYSGNVGRERSKSQRFERGPTSGNKNGQCFCDRVKYVPVTNLINSGYGNMDGYDECNYKSVGTNFSSHSYNPPTQHNDSSEMESQLKWFIKGLLTALKGHHDVKSTESNKTKSGSESNPQNEGKLEQRTENSFREGKVEKGPQEEGLKSGKRPPDPPNDKEKENSATSEENGKNRDRETSVLSDIASFMVKKENEKNQSTGNDQQRDSGGGTEPDSSGPTDKQDIMKNKLDQVGEMSCPLLGANIVNCKLNSNSAQNGKNFSGSGNELVYHKNFNLEDPSVQELVKDVLSVFCTKFQAKEGNLEKSGYEVPTVDPISCSNANSDEIVQQVCNVLKGTTTTARASTQTSNNADGNDEDSRNQPRRSCSYFYPICDDNNVSNAWNRYYCCRSLNLQTESCCCNEEQNSIGNNCCSLPLQEAFKRYNTTCYRRVKMRQACISNCKREREQQRQQRMESLVKALTNRSRPYTTTPARCRENVFCGRSVNSAAATTRGDQDACEVFTYVVPQSQMYWQCF